MFRSLAAQTRVPGRPAGRIIMFFWWIYSMLISVAYLSSLVAYLAVPLEKTLFTSLQDVLQQTEYKIGTLGGSVYVTDFRVKAPKGFASYGSHEN